MDFSQRLECLIKDKNLTAKAVAEHLGLGRTTINDWKRGKSSPSPSALIGLSQLLNVSIDYLLTGENFVGRIPEKKVTEVETVQGNIVRVAGSVAIHGVNVLCGECKYLLSISCLQKLPGMVNLYKKADKTDIYEFKGTIELLENRGVDQLMVIIDKVKNVEFNYQAGTKAIDVLPNLQGIQVNFNFD